MNDLTSHPTCGNLVSKIKEIESELALLVKNRDNLLFHVCPKLKTEYMLKIGKIEYSIFEYQCKILRLKREVEIIQSFKNRDQSYNIAKIEKQLDIEYKEYTAKLLEKQKEIEGARFRKSNSGLLLPEEDVQELRKLYVEIVKKTHPDINPDLTEEQHDHYIDAVNAYKNGDLAEMKVIFLLLEKTPFDIKPIENSIEKLNKRYESLSNVKEYMNKEIERIKESFPYNIMKVLSDENKVQAKIDELSNELTLCCEQYKSLELRLQEVINNE